MTSGLPEKLSLGILASHPIQYQAPLFRELARRCELTVFFAHRQRPEQQAQAGFGVAFDWDVDLLQGYAHRFLANVSHEPRVDRFAGCDTPSIAGEIAPGRFDAFIVMGWYLKSYWQAIRACRRHGVAVMVRGDSQLVTPRGVVKRLAKRIAYPWLLRQFDACLYVGQRNRDYLRHYGVGPDRLYFAPHCIDNDAFAARARASDSHRTRTTFMNADDEDRVLLFAGKLVQSKRPRDLLEAARLLRQRGVRARVVFAGDGPLRAELQASARSLEVPISLLGFCNQTELPAVYGAADVLVLPSDETWGLVVNEALACGTPVVVSDAAGCAADLAVPGAGEAYPVGDVPALAAAAARVLDERPAPESIRAVIERYSIRAAAQGIMLAAQAVRARPGART